MAPEADGELLVGRYRKLAAIGVGGMARVYLAHDELLGRRVAIKLLHADSPDDAAIRFEREAKLGASLNHPSLVSIFDIATDAESVLIVMEYVEGETLQDAIARGPVAPERAIEIVRDVADALDHAHAHGVVHRDVKPANILLRRDGAAKLADLGIATAAERTAITRSDVVLGTASYMAPEQLAGERAGPAADVYALAAVAYEALSGRKARSGRTPVEVAHDVVSGPPPDLGAVWREAPEPAVATLARGMARDPADRPESAGALAHELERGLARRPVVSAHAEAATEPLPRRSRATSGGRTWATRLALGAALVVAAVAGVAALGPGDDGRDSATRERAAAGEGRAGERAGSRDEPASGPADDDPAGRAEPADEAAPAGETAPSDPAPAQTPADDPVALNDRGYALMQSGEYEQAIPLLERAVAAFPAGSQELTYAYALYNLGRSLRLAGRPAEAVPVLERRLQIPNQTETVQRELDAARSAAG